MSRYNAPRFALTSKVYPVLDPVPESAMLVTGHLYRPGNHLLYLCAGSDGEEKQRLECELTDEVTYGAGSGGGMEEAG